MKLLLASLLVALALGFLGRPGRLRGLPAVGHKIDRLLALAQGKAWRETNGTCNLRTLSSAEAGFRSNAGALEDFWTADVSSLYTMVGRASEAARTE